MREKRQSLPQPKCVVSPIGLIGLFVAPVFWLLIQFSGDPAGQAVQGLTPIQVEDVLSKGVLRVATREGPLTYHQDAGGGISGLEADLAKGFADSLGVEVEFVVARTIQEVYDLVRRGQVHMAAAGLIVSPERMSQVRYGPSYMQVRQQLVVRQGIPAPERLEDIGNAYIHVVADSGHAETLRDLSHDNPEIVPQPMARATGTDLIAMLSRKELDYALVDSSMARWARVAFPNIKVAFDVGDPRDHAWAFPPGEDDSLSERAALFINEIKANGELDRFIDRYFDHLDSLDPNGSRQFVRDVRYRLPAYRQHFIQAAQKHGLDWRLLAAVGYQESGWNPGAVATTGTRGMMQFTGVTALELGIGNPHDARSSIEGAARYLHLLEKQLPQEIAEVERPWFALAAYNIGIGTVYDAIRKHKRRHATDINWDNFRVALVDAAQGSAFNRKRRELTLHYVDSIRAYYDLMVWVTERAPRMTAQQNTG
ncbi:MAG: membrane-bound lytic murein transglycosylase MltF [Pseudomonadota bacterium]